jgi:hypothetical protein
VAPSGLPPDPSPLRSQFCIINDRIATLAVSTVGRAMKAREPWGTLLTSHQIRRSGFSFIGETWWGAWPARVWAMCLCGGVWWCVVWWCVVVCGGVWWCVVATRWCVVVCGGVWLCVVVCGGVWWCVVVCGGLWRCVVVTRCVVVCGGVWCCVVVFGAACWTIAGVLCSVRMSLSLCALLCAPDIVTLQTIDATSGAEVARYRALQPFPVVIDEVR